MTDLDHQQRPPTWPRYVQIADRIVSEGALQLEAENAITAGERNVVLRAVSKYGFGSYRHHLAAYMAAGGYFRYGRPPNFGLAAAVYYARHRTNPIVWADLDYCDDCIQETSKAGCRETLRIWIGSWDYEAVRQHIQACRICLSNVRSCGRHIRYSGRIVPSR